ncbi:hypothetical protein PR048_008895, partial [Dryococelus australis]
MENSDTTVEGSSSKATMLGDMREPPERRIFSRDEALQQWTCAVYARRYIEGTHQDLKGIADIAELIAEDAELIAECAVLTVVYVVLTASHQGEPGSIPGRVTTGFLQVGISPEDAASRRDFPRISRFPHPYILALLIHYHLISPSSPPKNSLLRAAQISPLKIITPPLPLPPPPNTASTTRLDIETNRGDVYNHTINTALSSCFGHSLKKIIEKYPTNGLAVHYEQNQLATAQYKPTKCNRDPCKPLECSRNQLATTPQKQKYNNNQWKPLEPNRNKLHIGADSAALSRNWKPTSPSPLPGTMHSRPPDSLPGNFMNNGQQPIKLWCCSAPYLRHDPSPLLQVSTSLATTQECFGETGWHLSQYIYTAATQRPAVIDMAVWPSVR